MKPVVTLNELPDHPGDGVEQLLHDFAKAWDEHRLWSWVQRLPAPEKPDRRSALLGMIKIDLERRWQTGQKLRLEAYFKAFPELGGPAAAPVDLICAECEARRQYGRRLDWKQLARRFPQQIDAVRQRLGADDSCQSEQGQTPPLKTPDHAISPAHGGSPALPSGYLPEQFGRYRILKQLGCGEMGAVYLAYDTQLERRVALKIPHIGPHDDPELQERFFREAKIAATLFHPNLCPIFDVGTLDGIHYLTMAYIRGRPLSRRVARGTVPSPRQTAATIRRLAQALQEAHSHGVIHRDLKPANIMVTLRGEPIILDFGLARRPGTAEQRLTKNGQMIGTPAYMSPEQVSGSLNAVGPASDIYALGVIMYELLTGTLPFGGSVATVLAKILTKEPEPPSLRRPGVDPQLEAICLKALSKVADRRYATMEEFATALTDWMGLSHKERSAVPSASRPVATTAARLDSTPTRPVGAWAARHWRGSAAASPRASRWRWVIAPAGTALIAALLGVVNFIRHKGAPPAPAEALASATHALQAPDQAASSGAMALQTLAEPRTRQC